MQASILKVIRQGGGLPAVTKALDGPLAAAFKVSAAINRLALQVFTPVLTVLQGLHQCDVDTEVELLLRWHIIVEIVISLIGRLPDQALQLMATAIMDDGQGPEPEPEQPGLAAPGVRPGYHEASQRLSFSLREV